MTAPLDIALIAFDGIQILDVTGPAAVFSAANDACGRPVYRLHILSPAGGMVSSNSGVAIATTALAGLAPDAPDTVLVSGGSAGGLERLAAAPGVRAWLLAAAGARRFGSVCSGALALAALGLIDGKRVATHWEDCAALARAHPAVQVDANALYIEDGRLWTSAGVTTGIDMCLAMVENDVGAGVANAIAERLVLYARRPGYQSQFSPLLGAQARAGSAFSDLIAWMLGHPAAALDVASLAARAAMSERSFHRKFSAAVGQTPARFVETLRLDHARHLLAAPVTLKEVAARAGFATPAALSIAFERRFGISPALFRAMHQAKKNPLRQRVESIFGEKTEETGA